MDGIYYRSSAFHHFAFAVNEEARGGILWIGGCSQIHLCEAVHFWKHFELIKEYAADKEKYCFPSYKRGYSKLLLMKK